MPIHVYLCERCKLRFEEFRQYGDPNVGNATCVCGGHAAKVWGKSAVGIPDRFEPHYCEQLDEYITSRADIRRAMKEIEADSDGLVKPEYDWRKPCESH